MGPTPEIGFVVLGMTRYDLYTQLLQPGAGGGNAIIDLGGEEGDGGVESCGTFVYAMLAVQFALEVKSYRSLCWQSSTAASCAALRISVVSLCCFSAPEKASMVRFFLPGLVQLLERRYDTSLEEDEFWLELMKRC